MPDKPNHKRSHRLEDHLHGSDYDHSEDPDEDADHDHDHYEADGRLEDNALWIQDHVSLLSVGIDIGSSGTQVIFSRINLRRMGEELSSRYFVVSRETLFQSPVSLTPYRSEESIDDTELAAIIDRAFADAGLHPDDIDAGVVILTGEALRRENAGFHGSRGDVADAAAMERVAEWMADAVLASVSERSFPAAVQSLFLTEPLPGLDGVDGVMFSGGVAEYVYQREMREFGDMGPLFGRALRRKVDAGALPWPLLPPGECIRATALGASEYSVQLSGNTIYISNPGALLPRRNLQVLQPSYVCEDAVDPDLLAQAIREHFKAFDLVEGESEAALALRWEGSPSYERISGFAQGIRRGLANTIAKRMPLYIMVDGDIAQTLGAILRDEMGVDSEILVIDGVVLWDFDYIDLGRIRMPSQTVPVTVKSLVFSEDPRDPQGRARRPHRRHHEVPPG